MNDLLLLIFVLLLTGILTAIAIYAYRRRDTRPDYRKQIAALRREIEKESQRIGGEILTLREARDELTDCVRLIDGVDGPPVV